MRTTPSLASTAISVNPFQYDLKQASEGDAKAQFRVALAYRNGNGVEPSDSEAVGYYHLAAAQGLKEAYYNLAVAYATGLGVKQDIGKAVGFFYQARKRGIPTYDQDTVRYILTHFCNDPRYNPGKKRFGDSDLEDMAKGLCSGHVTYFLVDAYCAANKEEKEEKKGVLGLTLREQQREAVLGWDGERVLTAEEQQLFWGYLETTYSLQHSKEFHGTKQDRLDSLVYFIDKKARRFTKEFSCTFNVTQDEFVKILDQVSKRNRMMYIKKDDHAVGLFNDRFLGPDTREGEEKLSSSEEVATAIFRDMDFDPERRSIITLHNFTADPVKATYPLYRELLVDCEASEPDEEYNNNNTALLQSIFDNAPFECFLHYLSKDNDFINLEDGDGLTPLAAALDKDFVGERLDFARALLAQGAEWPESYPDIEENLTKLKKEREENASSMPLQQLVRQGVLTRLSALAMSPEERALLELGADIATVTGYHFREEKSSFNDETVRCVLKQVQSHIRELKIDTNVAPKVYIFQSVLAKVDIDSVSLIDLDHQLRDALNMKAIRTSHLERIYENYILAKKSIFASSPSADSLKALEEMSYAKSDEERSEVALRFIKAHPKNALAEQILKVVPGLGVIRQAFV